MAALSSQSQFSVGLYVFPAFYEMTGISTRNSAIPASPSIPVAPFLFCRRDIIPALWGAVKPAIAREWPALQICGFGEPGARDQASGARRARWQGESGYQTGMVRASRWANTWADSENGLK